MKTNNKHIIALIIMSLTPALSWSVNPHDEYYADDIFTAINEAKKRPHHYDYSTAKRYNRSTTQSLDIPRLLNKEMSITSIDSKDENLVTAADTPVSKQHQEAFDVNDDGGVETRALPINTVAPILGNPNVISPNVRTNIIAR
jgi:hypothetical protein